MSKDGVVLPKQNVAKYVFSRFCKSSIILVFFPVQIKSNPVAKGSNVPAWPTLIFLILKVFLKSFLSFFTTSNEVQFNGLKTGIINPSTTDFLLKIIVLMNMKLKLSLLEDNKLKSK